MKNQLTSTSQTDNYKSNNIDDKCSPIYWIQNWKGGWIFCLCSKKYLVRWCVGCCGVLRTGIGSLLCDNSILYSIFAWTSLLICGLLGWFLWDILSLDNCHWCWWSTSSLAWMLCIYWLDSSCWIHFDWIGISRS